jgi:L-rhamnose mutarotase
MRSAYILRIRPGKEEQYRLAHENVWPELIQAASDAGIRNHRVFMHGRTLFVYVEADDVGQATHRLLEQPIKKRWDAYMSDPLEPTNVLLDEVFHMD